MGNSLRVGPYVEEDLGLFSNFSDLAKASKTKKLESGGEFRFISLSEMMKHCEFLRCPLDNNRTKLLTRKDLQTSFVVFISHTWLRGSPQATGYDGVRHPDTADNEKYKLTIEALIKIHRIYAPAHEEIWIWMDFGCINQNNNPADSASMLSDVIYFSDCILTPIVDESADSWSYDPSRADFNALSDYRSPAFHRGSHAYLNRAWCRLEMFFASSLPLKSTGPRVAVSREMQMYSLNGVRPHFLFGSKESLEGGDPLLVPALTLAQLDQFDPRRGQLTCPSDELVVQKLVDNELMLLLNSQKPCYVGERNSLLQKHGKGRTVDEHGDIYEGEYVASKRQGRGKMIWSNGDVYEGEWSHNVLHGYGRLVYADGEVYEGHWKDELRHGKGKVINTDGSEYEGDFLEGSMTGHGTYLLADHSHYEGDVVDGVREGYGVLIYPNLDVYRGQFSRGNLHGKGVYRDSKGNEYSGRYMHIWI